MRRRSPMRPIYDLRGRGERTIFLAPADDQIYPILNTPAYARSGQALLLYLDEPVATGKLSVHDFHQSGGSSRK